MNKIVLKFVGLVASFFLIWFLLSLIDWATILEVEEKGNKTEKAVGDLYVDAIHRRFTMITEDSLAQPVIDIIDKIKEANDLDSDFKLHFIVEEQINAFAFPDDNIGLLSGLVLACESPEELAGVIGHEIAHLEKNHVMKKLIREVGLSTLVSMASGSNSTVIQETFKKLTSSAYDRSLESEADLTSIEYLNNAKIDHRPLAEFMFRLSLDQGNVSRNVELFSSHPASEDRAKYILEENKDIELTFEPIMSEEKWKAYQAAVKSYIAEK